MQKNLPGKKEIIVRVALRTGTSFSQLALSVALLLLLNLSTFAQTPLCLKNQKFRLDRVSTARGSGWVHIQHARFPLILTSIGSTHPLPRAVLTRSNSDLGLLRQSPKTQSGAGLPLTETPVEYTIGGNERLRHSVTLDQNEFLQVRVVQKHADVLLTLLDAGGNELAQMNFLDRDDVVETLSFVATQKGDYVLEVRMVDPKAASGSYTIRREPPRKAEARDTRRVAVEKLFMEAMLERSKEWNLKPVINKFTEALAGWQELADSYMAELTAWKLKQTKAVARVREAGVLLDRKSYQEASKELLETAHEFHEIDDVYGECASLLGAATVHAFLGDSALSLADKTVHYKQAMSLSQQALPLLRKLPGSRDDEVKTLAQIAMMARIIGDKSTAIEHLIQEVPLYEQLGQLSEMATTENTIGGLYIEINQYDNALEYLNRALAHREKDKCGSRATLTNIGIAYSAKGEKARALEYLHRALAQDSNDNTCPQERAVTLTNIGKVYNDIGENKLALVDYLCPSSKLPETIKDGNLAAATKNNIGTAYYALGQDERALEYYQSALSLYKSLLDEKNAATILSNIGVVHSVLGENQAALNRFKESLEIRRKLADQHGEAITLNNIGEVYAAEGDIPAARTNFDRALPLFRAAGDRNGEAITLGNEMSVWSKLGNRRMAIFFGKQAVNRLQQLRGAVRSLDNEIQKNYLRTVKRTYQQLAELLIEEGLYEQAAQVLHFYQDEQFFDLKLEPDSSVPQTDFSPRERDLATKYAAASSSLEKLGSRIGELTRQLRHRPPKEGETAELQNLQAQLKTASEAFSTVLRNGEKMLAKTDVEQDRVKSVKGVSEMRTVLAQSKQKTVTLYTLVGSNKLYVLLLKPNGFEAYSHALNAGELRKMVDNVLGVVINRRITGPELLGPCAALYDLIFKSTSMHDQTRSLAAALSSYKPDVLLWSLDGDLRYIPVAVLYDTTTRQYLLEKYQNVVFTRAEPERFLRESREWTGGVSFGKSTDSTVTCASPEKKHQSQDFCEGPAIAETTTPDSFAALPAVAIDVPVMARILHGPFFLNKRFTRQSLLDNIRGKKRPLIHISSHFCFKAGDLKNSFLLLGDDKKFSLFELKDYANLFDGVDLLVLSACKTGALQAETETGREIDSLAELSQRLRANSVIAALWDADAVGSGKLMIEIYRQHKKNPKLTKAELLQRAQLSFLKGKIPASENIDHPSYWAPFVLYGNFR